MEMVYERVLDFWVLGSEFSPAAGKKRPIRSKKKLLLCKAGLCVARRSICEDGCSPG